VNELVHLALSDVRAVDERLGVHPQEFGHLPTNVSSTLDGLRRRLEDALRRRRAITAEFEVAFDLVFPAVVGEPQFDLALLLTSQ